MELNESMLRQIIERTLQEMRGDGMVKHVDPSGVMSIRTSTVRCEPFAGAKDVGLKDATTLEEAPRMGAGVMELDHGQLEWTLTYDEYDYVIEGTLQIEIDGRVVTGNAGDIIYIPKNSHIIFKTPSWTRYAYFVYPANWADLV